MQSQLCSVTVLTPRALGARADDLARLGDTAVQRRGFPDLATYVIQGLAAGRSLAALSTAAGLPRDWLARHVDQVIDDAAWLGLVPVES